MVNTPLVGEAPPSSLPQSAPYRGSIQRNASGLGHAASNGFVKWTSLTKQNYAAVLHGVNDMRFEEFPLASTLKEGSVRIEIKAVGICGSDVHYWKRVRSTHIRQQCAKGCWGCKIFPSAGEDCRFCCERADGHRARVGRVSPQFYLNLSWAVCRITQAGHSNALPPTVQLLDAPVHVC